VHLKFSLIRRVTFDGKGLMRGDYYIEFYIMMLEIFSFSGPDFLLDNSFIKKDRLAKTSHVMEYICFTSHRCVWKTDRLVKC